MTKPFGKPDEPVPGGDYVRLDNLIDRLLLIRPKSKTMVASSKTDANGNKQADYARIVADVVVLDGRPSLNKKPVTLPHVISDMWITGAQLVPQIEKFIGNAEEPYALGRLVLGEPNAFGTSAKVLDPFDEAEAAIATEYLESLATEEL